METEIILVNGIVQQRAKQHGLSLFFVCRDVENE